MHCSGLRRNGLEYWIAALAEVSRREPLVLRNDALVRSSVKMMRTHEVGPTMLPTASTSSSTEGELGSCSSTVAVLLLSWVVQLLVRHK